MKTKFADFSYELPLWQNNIYIIGVDEVGRGCLAGPVHVGGVCFPLFSLSEQKKLLKLKIHDSKQCTAEKRTKLAPLIKEYSCGWSIASSSVDEINSLGIVPAIEKAACNVVEEIKRILPIEAKIIVFTDTLPIKRLKRRNFEQTPIPQGDAKSISIAAASIIAKVERDQMMNELHNQFPAYAWRQNKGYATKTHRQAILETGLSPLHRTLYVRKLLEQTM